MSKKLLIIDSNSLIHRAYHALPPLKTKKGELVNAVYGFLLVFFKALKEFKPDFIAATFDFPAPTFRHKEFKEYKAKRPPTPQELYQQIKKVKEVLRVFNVPIFEKQGFEADDLIGTISRQVSKRSRTRAKHGTGLIPYRNEISGTGQPYPEIETIILSGDLDNLQLVNENTKVYTLGRGIKDAILYGIKKVEERYQGLRPSQLNDFKALRGDPSDNIPGVTGIGEKTAIKLIKEFGTLENLYSALNQRPLPKAVLISVNQRVRALLEQYKKQAFISKSLVQMQCNVPVDFRLKDCQFGELDREKIIEIFKELEFYTLIKRLEDIKNQSDLFLPESVSDFDSGKREIEIGEIEKLYEQGVFSKKIYQIEKKLIPIVKEMEGNGIKVNSKALSKLSKNLEFKIKNLEEKVYKIARGKFNLNSPQQVSEILFEKLKISIDGIKKTPKGAISTSSQELQKLKKVHPMISLILEYRQLFKLKSGFVDSLPKMAESKDRRIHPHFHPLGTETGRMSCSEPNLQNIPIKGEIGREIRKCFIPEPGFKFLSADYSQVELRIAASIANDEKMQELFQKGEDIHKLTATQIFKVSQQQVDEKKRSLAKTLNYAIFYGMGKKSFSQRVGVSPKTAEEFINKYFDSFKQLAEYVDNSKQKARRNGYVQTIFGRKRFLPEINSIDPRLRAQAERIAVNMPIQGCCADIIKMAMVKLFEEKITNKDCKLVLQIHDELLFEIKNEKIKEKAQKIKEIMENIVKLDVPLKIDLRVGSNWGELENMVE